ncbi:lipocalin-like domain-containing protein [Streptomyces pathocidini]
MVLSAAQLVGTWTLETVTVTRPGSTITLRNPDVSGMLCYSPDHHLLAMIRLSKAPPAAGSFPLPEFIAYAGCAAISGDQIECRVQIGSDRALVGSVQTRMAVLRDHQLHLSTSYMESEAVLTWRKAAS